MAGCPLHIEAEAQLARKQLPHDEPHCLIDSSTAFVSEIANLRKKRIEVRWWQWWRKRRTKKKHITGDSWRLPTLQHHFISQFGDFWISFILCYVCQVKLFAFTYCHFTVDIQSLFHCKNANTITLMLGFIQVVDFRFKKKRRNHAYHCRHVVVVLSEPAFHGAELLLGV